VVLLNFWFPGCACCKIELPFEKRLVKKFNKNKFKLINICFYAEIKDWHRAIKQFNLEGINLFANMNWQSKLEKRYKISSFPHYTLIDKKGIIYSNHPKRPSEGISADISKLIND